MSTAEPVSAPVWKPTERQRAFLASSAYEALYGGAAGGGKTQALVIGALYDIDKPSYNAIIFRRTFPELEGEVIPVSRQWYPACGGKYNAVQHCWTFPSGARIHFGHLQHEHDVERYQGWQFQYVGYDELTHFTEKQYTYIANSRVRSAQGIRPRVRCGTNPGGVGHEWVMKRWAPWLDPESAVNAEPGQTLHYRNKDDGPEWCERGPGTLSRVFVPALLDDNPHLVENDPGYADRLRGLDRVTRARLLTGDWLMKPAAGAYYQRAWFAIAETRSVGSVLRVRRWDLASTENGGDWTVGVRMALMPDRSFVVEDVVRVRMRPAGVEETVMNTAKMDGHDVHVALAQDPGQAGKAQLEAFVKKLVGYVVSGKPETGDKTTRQAPFSAQCEAKNVTLVRGTWNEPFLQCLEAFGDPKVHDDDVDAAAGAFTYLSERMSSLARREGVKRLAEELRTR